MKKFSLQSFVAGAASFCRLKSMQTLLLAGLFCVTGGSAFANVTVTPASGGTGICPTLATGGGASAYTTTGSITITEGATNDLSTGTNQLILTPPSGWHFNTGYFPGIGWTGGADITNITSSYSGGNLVINIVCSGTTATDQIIIGALQVQANSPASSAGYIYASTSFIAGIATGSTGTDFGDLSLASGSTPSVSISVSPSNTICAGDGVTFTPSPTNGGVGPSYTWYVNGSSVGSGGTYSTSLLSNGQVVNCVMTAGGGSCIYPLTATSNSITMTVNPVPTTVTVSSSGTYCGSTTLTASGGTGGTIYFQGTTSGGTSTATPSTSQVISSTGTYYFRAQSAGGCWGPQGSATVTINPVPNPVTVTGGTTTCGGTQTITASGGAGGTIYFQGTTSGGTSTASATSSQVISTSGTYYFRSQSAAGCWGTEGSTIVVINPLPTAFNVTGGGAYCAGGAGVAVGLSNSTSGVTYQLYVGASPVGSPVSGTGAAISFGNQTVAGSYTVVATVTATGCVNNMTGSVTVSINSLPSIFSVTGTASYCAGGTGVPVGLSGSTVGVNYQLYRNGTPLGGPQSGTGGVITFGNQTLAGTYTVVATDAFTGCTSNMSGSAIVSIDPLPTAFSVSGGGSYCAGGSGIAVGLAGSQGGVNYQLYVNGLPTGAPVAGTGTAITFGLQTTAGTYTVVATNTLTTCTNTMTGSVTVSINSLPNAYIVTGGGGYCVGGTGVHVGLSTSDIGISYQLYLGGVPTGSAVPGTGGALDFGLHATTGVYTVVATNPFTTCTANMTGSVTVFTNPLPNAYTVFGGGQYCAGGSGVNVFLSGSDGGVNYQLYNGITPAGSPVAGFGFGFTFGLETAAGVYTAIAIDATTGCVQNMTGSATVIVNPLPLVFNVTGGGAYCSGGSGVHVGLSGSTPGISYELYIGGSPTGTILSGTGGVLDFGFQTTAGAYTVVATNLPTGCTSNMSGSVNVTINPLPNAYTVTTFGVSSYCAGGSGVNIFLSPSDVGVNYQLYLGGVPVGSSVAGNGGVISFGSQTIAGTYTVIGTDATTLCTNTMFGSATISIDPLPVAYAVTGGGAYCFGGAGVPVGVANSETGIQYQLFLGGVPVGGLVGGTSGSAITFGNQTSAGNYTVTGYNFILAKMYQ